MAHDETQYANHERRIGALESWKTEMTGAISDLSQTFAKRMTEQDKMLVTIDESLRGSADGQHAGLRQQVARLAQIEENRVASDKEKKDHWGLALGALYLSIASVVVAGVATGAVYLIRHVGH
jgi:hypothetical protein